MGNATHLPQKGNVTLMKGVELTSQEVWSHLIISSRGQTNEYKLSHKPLPLHCHWHEGTTCKGGRVGQSQSPFELLPSGSECQEVCQLMSYCNRLIANLCCFFFHSLPQSRLLTCPCWSSSLFVSFTFSKDTICFNNCSPVNGESGCTYNLKNQTNTEVLQSDLCKWYWLYKHVSTQN